MSNASNGASSTPLELLALFGPFLQSREEAARIRGTLASYLESLIELPEDSYGSRLHLATSGRAVKIKQIPSFVTGVQRDYLKALQANITGQRQHASTVEKLTLGADSKAHASHGSHRGAPESKDEDLNLQAYLELLQEREKLEKLQIYHHYLDKVMAKESGSAEYPDSRHLSEKLEPSINLDPVTNSQQHSDLDLLTERLEKAVLQARGRLLKEQRLLAELKADFPGESNASLVAIRNTPRNEIPALQRTKDELVNWIEVQLAKSADEGDNETADESRTWESTPSTSTSEKLGLVETHYSRYMEARRSLITSAYNASDSIATTKSEKVDAILRAKTNMQQFPTAPSNLQAHVLNLVRLTKAQNSLSTLKGHLLNIMADEKLAVLQGLHRLNDESHLLPTYPLPAKSNKFQRTETLPLDALTMDRRDADLIAHAEAWSYACRSSGEATTSHVLEKTEFAEEYLSNAQNIIAHLQRILGENGRTVEEAAEKQEQDEGDIWALQAREKNTTTAKGFKGPFSELDGDF